VVDQFILTWILHTVGLVGGIMVLAHPMPVIMLLD